jgi:P27 family predicted phage terminase small subunit
MGRPRKPTHLKIIEGSRDRRPLELQNSEPRPEGEVGPPPAYFTEQQKVLWSEVRSLCPGGLIRRLDSYVFEQFVIAVARARDVNERLKGAPQIIKTSSGAVIENPLFRVARQQALIIKAFSTELGFSPVARTRSATGVVEFDDPNDKYFR